MSIARNRKRERGAVALEYILIAALVAIALISTFVYFRKSMTASVKGVADTTTNTVQSAIDTTKDDTTVKDLNAGSPSQ